MTPLFDYGKLYCSASSFIECRPRSVTDVVGAIARARDEGRTVRVRGSAHTFTGATLPRDGELLVRTHDLDRYIFEKPGTVRVGAGAIGWDVRDFVATFGYEMPVYNGGWAGPTVGGYLSAGGMGLRVPPDVRARWLTGDAASAEAPPQSISEVHGGFWEHVAAVTLVDGTGTVHEIDERDEVFPWLFGSYGQFGVVTEVTLKLLAREQRPYPTGEHGRVPRMQREDVSINDRPPAFGGDHVLCWFSVLVDEADEPAAWHELGDWVDRHAPHLRPTGGWTGPSRCDAPIGYRYVVRFGRFNPPLLYPRADSFVLLGLMAPFVGVGTIAGDERLLAAERDFVAVATRCGFRLYPQAENIGRTLDYATYYGPGIFETFASLKRRFDPDGVINPGTVFPSPLRQPARTSETRLAEVIFGRVLDRPASS